MQNTIVQTLFDSPSYEWYAVDAPVPTVPPREEASTEVLQELLEIAALALRLRLTEETREAVLRARGEIEGILRTRGVEPVEPKAPGSGKALYVGLAAVALLVIVVLIPLRRLARRGGG